jgi:hypothetical protein
MPLSVALDMGRLVQQNHKNTLQKILIVEGHWFFQFLLTCILPFLNAEMRNKFVLVNGSLLEVTAQLRELGLTLRQLEPLRSHFG